MISELVWDTALFKRKIGRLTKVPAESRLKGLIRQAEKEGYAYLTCRIPGGNMSALQLLEAHGFYTVDVGVVWKRESVAYPDQPFPIKEASPRDFRKLTAMSAGLFKSSRFYNDPFFSAEDADRLYSAWIRNALRDGGCRTYLIKDSGFLVCRQKKGSGDIALIGVVPGKQGRGIGRSLVLHALTQLRDGGQDTLTVRTQIKNISAMNFYLGLGFKIQYTDTTMARVITA
ncbi:MAG: hypothetical protein C0402_06650 [Thermodesulfovibrio sp.]|nr:hypothetical protein [Thermodesulfovibrio sp.]